MLCVNHSLKVIGVFVPYISEVEQQGCQSLILRRGAYILFYGKIGQKLIYFFLSELLCNLALSVTPQKGGQNDSAAFFSFFTL